MADLEELQRGLTSRPLAVGFREGHPPAAGATPRSGSTLAFPQTTNFANRFGAFWYSESSLDRYV